MSLLRPATPDELPKLLPLVERYHAFEGIELSADLREEAVLTLLSNPDLGRIFLIGPGQAPVGYLALTFGFSIELGGRDAFIDEFFIRERVRGKGLGTQVMAALPAVLAEHGIKAVHLEVAKDNDTAQRLYQRGGFRLRDRYCLMSRTGA